MANNTTHYRFTKEERLCSKKLIDTLFVEGQRLMVYPYSIHYQVVEELPAPAQVLVVAQKKKFHHAVDRNRVKRLTRECYRLHKPKLYSRLQEMDVHLVLSLTYVHNEIMDYAVLSKKFDRLIDQLCDKIALQRSKTAVQNNNPTATK